MVLPDYSVQNCLYPLTQALFLVPALFFSITLTTIWHIMYFICFYLSFLHIRSSMRVEVSVCLNPAVCLLCVRQCAKIFISFLLFFLLLLHWAACGILVPQRGGQPTPFTVRAWSPNPWTTREFPQGSLLFLILELILQGRQHLIFARPHRG